MFLQIDISSHTGIFVTLNPAGKEYGGRQKLPDNLKLLFRPVVMSAPDNELIAEVILFSQGFHNAKVIGKKLVEIFSLAQSAYFPINIARLTNLHLRVENLISIRKLLSRQQHYDWGLRALKSVLRTAGDQLRQSISTDPNLSQIDAEHSTIVRALNFNTLSKLTADDSVLFLGLIADMFPQLKTHQDELHAKLMDLIKTCCDEMGFIALDKQVTNTSRSMKPSSIR